MHDTSHLSNIEYSSVSNAAHYAVPMRARPPNDPLQPISKRDVHALTPAQLHHCPFPKQQRNNIGSRINILALVQPTFLFRVSAPTRPASCINLMTKIHNVQQDRQSVRPLLCAPHIHSSHLIVKKSVNVQNSNTTFHAIYEAHLPTRFPHPIAQSVMLPIYEWIVQDNRQCSYD